MELKCKNCGKVLKCSFETYYGCCSPQCFGSIGWKVCDRGREVGCMLTGRDQVARETEKKFGMVWYVMDGCRIHPLLKEYQ